MKKTTILLAAAAIGLSAAAAVPYKLGIAGYTYHKKSLDQCLEDMQKMDVHYLCVKDFHFSYDSTDEQIAAFKQKCAKYGVVPYALGPLYVNDVSKLRPFFEFARRMGVKVVVGVPYEQGDEKDSWNKRKPSVALLKEIDRLVKEFDIRYAIHNHGPASPTMYPDVKFTWELVKDLDERVGFCMDVGWDFGNGNDPVETIRKYGSRIYDMHFKNFDVNKPDGASVPLSRGKMDYVKIMRALAEIGYDGVTSLEYEADFEDNLAPLSECVGYWRGVADSIVVPAKMKPAPKDANTLTDAEKAEGWKLLWDGKTLDGWLAVKKDCKAPPEKGWVIADGTLTMRPVNGISPEGNWFPLPPEDQKLGGGGDIVTAKKYRDFSLKFDFRMTRAANSGVKYYYDETQNRGTCEEYQILEPGHPDSGKGRDGNRRVASLYDIYPAHADRLVKGIGEWNTGMIVAKGTHVEHWLNGVKVLEYERGSARFREGVKASKYADWGDGKPWGEIPEGRILLQDHSDSTVSFCNIKIKE